MTKAILAGFVALNAAFISMGADGQSAVAKTVEWPLDSLATIGGHPVTVAGTPRLVDTEIGKAVEFNGKTDGLFLDINPLAGLERFTIETVFAPAAGGPDEQRFVHFEEADTGNRALIELRMVAGASWHLDTYLRWGDAMSTLIDPDARHSAGEWHVAALTYDGRTMTHYVNGVRERSGDVGFRPLGAGVTSIGVRRNRVSWFMGRIRLIRITPDALPAERLQRR